MIWFRIDNRLVHGQVIEAWVPYVGADYLVVANDELAADPFRQQIISLAVPQRIIIHFVSIAELNCLLGRLGSEEVMVLLADCQDAVRAYSSGVDMKQLNIGNLHYSQGKTQLLPHVAVSELDFSNLRNLAAHDVKLDFRCIPSESVRSIDDFF